MAVALAACGGDDDADPTPDTSVTTSVALPTPTTSRATDAPLDPTAAPSDEPAPPAVVEPEGFARVQATVELADGTPCELCLWLAADRDDRSRGLMEVTDLGDADGMAFVFPEPTLSRFWMVNTPLPLSIAFFAADGSFVSTRDMDPCPAADDSCLRYGADGEYVTAIELVQGDVQRLGIGPGSVLTLTDLPCE